jgi:hypothetical protein
MTTVQEPRPAVGRPSTGEERTQPSNLPDFAGDPPAPSTAVDPEEEEEEEEDEEEGEAGEPGQPAAPPP